MLQFKKNVWQVLSKFKLNDVAKMRSYTDWILIALAETCFFHIVINRTKIPLY